MFLAVHGGAGRYPADEESAVLDGCRRALAVGWAFLVAGAPALDVVEAAVRELEDNPIFNAGRGSVLNADGKIEMDASIMEGRTLRAGSVAAVQGIRNPISLARRVLEDGRHVLLVAAGAKTFARSLGIPDCPDEWLVSHPQQQRWQDHHGTVGAIALDCSGVVASATSTGGLFGKLPGRVGDSALIGCGTYADEVGAVSCTGTGEAIMRVAMAVSVLADVRQGLVPQAAAETAVAGLKRRVGARAGLIVVDAAGRVGYAHSTPDMAAAWRSSTAEMVTIRRETGAAR